MQDSKDKDVFRVDAIEDQVFAYRKASNADPEVMIAFTADGREAGKQKKSVGYGVDEPCSCVETSTFGCDIEPNIV